MRSGYALVTGASRGLGRHFAEELARRRQNLVLVARSRDKLENIAERLRTAHEIAVETVTIDLASCNAGQALARELDKRNLPIDLLVNNAGFGDQGEFFRLPLKRQLDMIHLQTSTIVELTHKLLSRMIEQRRGGIINVSSMAACNRFRTRRFTRRRNHF